MQGAGSVFLKRLIMLFCTIPAMVDKAVVRVFAVGIGVHEPIALNFSNDACGANCLDQTIGLRNRPVLHALQRHITVNNYICFGL